MSSSCFFFFFKGAFVVLFSVEEEIMFFFLFFSGSGMSLDPRCLGCEQPFLMLPSLPTGLSGS